MDSDSRFDKLFTSVAEQAGGISPLFDYFFGFLCRQTDFFSAQKSTCWAHTEESFKKWSAISEERKAKLKQQEVQKKKEAPKVPKSVEEMPANTSTPHAKQQEFLASRPKIEEVTDDDDGTLPVPSTPDGEETEDSPPPLGNGGQTDRYRWTQTLGTVDVYVPIPPGTRSASCQIVLSATKVKVGLKGQPPIIDGEFFMRVREDDSIWTLEETNTIHLALEKVDQMRWWASAIKGDPEIDTKKIVPENSKLSDLDADTRSTVEKMMFDQRQKQAGLPTSDQQKQAQLLEQFQKQHPELDFSKAKINYGNSGWGG